MSEHSRRKKARTMLHGMGYKMGGNLAGDERQDRAMIEHAVSKGVAEHEAHDHKGAKRTRLHFRDGGIVEGFAAGGRPDKKSAKHKGKTTVNVVVAPQGGGQPHPVPVPVPRPVPVPVGAAGGAPPVPPPGGAPMGGPMGMPQKPPGMLKNGGRARRAFGGQVKTKDYAHGGEEESMPDMEAGAAGGLGRLEKAHHEAKRPGGQRSSGR